MSEAPFDAVDSKLTIYALANGMDLEKADGSRRLSWFREGLDRGILIEAAADGSYTVTAMAWKASNADDTRRSAVANGVPREELAQTLSGLLEKGLEAANGL